MMSCSVGHKIAFYVKCMKVKLILSLKETTLCLNHTRLMSFVLTESDFFSFFSGQATNKAIYQTLNSSKYNEQRTEAQNIF